MMKRSIPTGIAFAAYALLASGTAHAAVEEVEDQAPAEAEQTASEGAAEEPQARTITLDPVQDNSLFEFSYSSPDSPALPLIGVEGDQIARVDSLRRFSFSFGNSFGFGDEPSAASFDFSPFWALAGDDLSLAEYRSSGAFQQVLARTKLGLAFSTGEEATGQPSSFVVSVATKLLQPSDPLNNIAYGDCIRSDPKQISRLLLLASLDDNGQNGNGSLEVPAAQLSQLQALVTACAERAAKNLEAQPFLDVGFAQRFSGDPGDLDNLESSGTMLWGTAGTGNILGKDGDGGLQAVAHARYTFDDDVFDESFVLQGERDSMQLTLGIESLPNPDKTERFRWSLQAGWNRQNAVLPIEKDQDFWRYQAVVDFRISDSLWLTGTFGRVSGEGVENDTKALVGLTFTPPGISSIFD